MGYRPRTLCGALFSTIGIKTPHVQDPYRSSLDPVLRLISWIYHLPIEHRKAVIDACRIQAPIWINKSLSATFNSLQPVMIYLDHGPSELSLIVITKEILADIMDRIYSFPILCSLAAYFARAESTEFLQGFLIEKTRSFNKELQAALWYENYGQALDYTGVFHASDNRVNPQLPGNISWRVRSMVDTGLRHIAQYFSSSTAKPLLPSYNGRKNVSYSTCRWYAHYHGLNHDDDNISTSITTLDLLRLYYETGEKAQGVIEMRQAWFFNDLKPRTYYCLGGNDFFHGMYIQALSNLFCAMFPSTNPFTRFSVERIGSLNYDDLLVTYDYTSFTTSLQELQFFLFWLAEHVGDVPVAYLDVFCGVKESSLRHILHDYNQAVNQHQMFSIERFQHMEELITLRQGRSGSLGVKGNIVFSTTLHGLSLADITNTPDDDCCVGDDALCKIQAWYIAIFITCVNNLGTIHPEKFTTIAPIRPDEERSQYAEQFKFLKRPLNLDHNNIPRLGTLDFFPSVADAMFPEGDGIHTVTPGFDEFTTAKTFAMQVGRYYRNHCGHASNLILEDGTSELILQFFGRVYGEYGLPLCGGIPGNFVVKKQFGFDQAGDYFCPPVDTVDVFDIPWMEILLGRFYGQKMTLPVTCGGTMPPPPEVCMGQKFRATSDVQVLSLLVDLGVLEKEVEVRWEFFDQATCEEFMLKMEGGGRNTGEPLLSTYTVISEPPDWWTDIVSYEYPENLPEDPLDIAERLSSIMSFDTDDVSV